MYQVTSGYGRPVTRQSNLEILCRLLIPQVRSGKRKVRKISLTKDRDAPRHLAFGSFPIRAGANEIWRQYLAGVGGLGGGFYLLSLKEFPLMRLIRGLIYLIAGLNRQISGADGAALRIF